MQRVVGECQTPSEFSISGAGRTRQHPRAGALPGTKR